MKKEQLKKGPSTKNPVKKDTQPKKQVRENKSYDLAGLLIIVVLGIIIYSNSFTCSFHLDDLQNIVDNTHIRNLWDIKDIWNFSPNRPVPIFTFALNYHFNQLDVRYWHLVNLIIHLINSWLVWRLTLLIFSSPAMKDQKIAMHKNMIAFVTALLFVSHPLATQSVTYIVQRMASMVAMFYLLSLMLYVKARLTNKGNQSKYLLFAGCLISGILAMLTKENAFTLPLAIVLFEFFFIRTKKLSINFKDYRVILLLATFLGVMVIILLKYSFAIFNPILPSERFAYTITPINYFLTQFSVFVKYIQLLILPINQNLDYDFPISNNLFEIRPLLSFLGLLSLIILAIFSFKRYRIISFGIFWFFITLLVESSFIPINDVIFEHRTYLPSFGFFLILSSAIYVVLWDKHKYLAISILVIIIGTNSYMTYERNKIWKDDLSLWSDVVSKSPHKARPRYDLGLVYMKLGQYDTAIVNYTKAIEIYPKYAAAYSNLGLVYMYQEQWDKAIANFSTAIGMDPKLVAAYNSRGSTYGKLNLWDKSIADFSKAIEIDPKFKDAYCNRGVTYANLGQWDKAISDFSRAIELDPNYTDAVNYRDLAYEKMRNEKKAKQ